MVSLSGASTLSSKNDEIFKRGGCHDPIKTWAAVLRGTTENGAGGVARVHHILRQ